MHKDIVVIGAGISGIAAGYNLKKSCPKKRPAYSRPFDVCKISKLNLDLEAE